MGRQRTKFQFSEHGIELLREYVNNKTTQQKMLEMFDNPELADLSESEIIIATSILDAICQHLKITGKPDMEQIKQIAQGE